MSLSLVIRDSALQEIADAKQFYNSRALGLGDDFVAEIERLVDRIQTTPEMFELVHRGVRRATIRRFPYVIYFQADETSVIVYCVAHSHRSDRYWRRRIK